MTAARRSWIAPAAIALVLALAGGGYAAFGRAEMAPQVTFISIAGDKISTESLRG